MNRSYDYEGTDTIILLSTPNLKKARDYFLNICTHFEGELLIAGSSEEFELNKGRGNRRSIILYEVKTLSLKEISEFLGVNG